MPPLPPALEREGWHAELERAFALANEPAFPAAAAATAALAVLDGYAAAVARDLQATAPLVAEAQRRGCFVRRIPELPRAVHDLDGLAEIERRFFEDEQEEP
jgi:anti-sigma-K factor RskA